MNNIAKQYVETLKLSQEEREEIEYVIEGYRAELDRLQTVYNELLMAVCSKHDGESRHQTALRYIRERESCNVKHDA